MAKYEKMLYGDFQELLDRLHQAVMDGSMTASYEEGSDYHQDGFDCAIRVYERYSALGGNRVSMTVVLTGQRGAYFLSAITSGGSQAMFFKMNTGGEEAFLQTIADVAEDL